MSTPMEKLSDAIREFAAEVDKEGLVVDWVVGYVTLSDVDGFHYSYSTAGATPHGALGIAGITKSLIQDDIEGVWSGDE